MTTRSSELLVLHNGTNAHITEYAVLETNGKLGDLVADISGSDVRLNVTMNTSSSATIKIHRNLVNI